MKFCKMNGLGNDYIFIDVTIQDVDLSNLDVPRLSNRHFGIGGDGVVLINNSTIADAKMTIYNADGSRAEMCGNALRCVARYLFDNIKRDKSILYIETDAGVKQVFLDADGMITARIGTAKITGKYDIKCGDRLVEFFAIDVGNPHAITLDNEWDIDRYGAQVSSHRLFPNGTNVEKLSISSRRLIKVQVYERGSGRTLACGTGATACAYLAMTLDRADDDVSVMLDGGRLRVKQIDHSLYITGDAKYNFYGEIDYYGKT